MKVIIVGCGRVGTELAYGLFRRGHHVSVIDILESSLNSLPSDFQGHLVEGDALNQDVLIRAGIETADALAVVTGSDALNLVIGHVAQTVYNLPNVVVRNYGPNCRALFEIFNLQVVSSTSWGAQRIEEMLSHSEVRTIFSAGNGEVEVYELTIPEQLDGKKSGEIQNAEAQIFSVTRAGRAFLPDQDSILHDGDVIHVSATFDGIETMRKLFFVRQKEG